jgi:hypothetical protein
MQFAVLLLSCALLSIAANLFCVYPVHSSATITVVDLDSASEGFNDSSVPDPDSANGGNNGATLGEQRFIAFQHAADIWGQLISSPVEIRVGARFDQLECDDTSAVLGAAGPNTVHGNFVGAPVQNTWYTQALANSLAAMDLDPSTDDIEAVFNSAIGTSCPFPTVWYYGLDGNPPSGKIDFVTVVLHELAHGLGFISLVDLATGEKLFGFNDIFMRQLENHSTGKRYPGMTNGERVGASKNTDGLHWVGAELVAASGILTDGVHPTGHVEMYAPNPQEPGASVSHFSPDLAPNQIMEPFYTAANHDVGLALELLQDLGWALTGDQSSPAAVADLTTSEPELTSIKLSWTAPGDDANTGTAASYDVRYASSAITNANWSSATPVGGVAAPSDAGLPETLTVSNLSCGRKYFFALKATDDNGNTSTISNVAQGTTEPCPTLVINSPLPLGEVNVSYNTMIDIGGGFPPYTVEVIRGALPVGLTLASPAIAGVPTSARTSRIAVRVIDTVGASLKKTLTLKVVNALKIVTNTLAAGRAGRSYQFGLKAKHGRTPYSWSMIGGTLPSGLSFDPVTSRITGTPTSAGTANLSFEVTDSLGAVVQKGFTLTVN